MLSRFRHGALGVLLACSGVVGTGGFTDDDVAAGDAGTTSEADASVIDASVTVIVDAGVLDASVFIIDAGSPADAAADAGAMDASVDFVCPTAPPFDATDARLQKCLEPMMLAVGNRARRIVSFDATSWLYDQLDDGNTINGSEYDDGCFGAAFGKGYVVTASDFGIFTSADRGKTWVKAASPAPQQWGQGVHVSPVAFNGRRFIVFGEVATFTSSDALVWQKHSVNTFAGSHVGFYGNAVGRNGRLVASGGGTKMNLSDDDGLTWRNVDIGLSGGLTSLMYANNTFVGVGKSARVYSTDNGDSWQVVNDDCASNDPTKCVGNYPTMITLREGKFTFTTNASKSAVLQSADGQTWAKIGEGFAFDWWHVYFNGVDYAVHGGNWLKSGASAGGPWPETQFPEANKAHGIERLVVGPVLKRP